MAGFTARDCAPGIEAMLVPGAVVALVPGEEGGGDPDGWLRPCGKTQLASFLAGSLWRSGGIDLLTWVDASSRAPLLAGYAAAAARLGLDDGGAGEAVAARFAGWLAGTGRRWLLVLDDLRDAADLEGLWPGGHAGRVLITAAHAGVVPGGWAVVPVPGFSLRESMRHLFDTVSDPGQRGGAYDLAEQLGGGPVAVAQAGAVLAGSGAGCRKYQRFFCEERARQQAAGGGEPPAGAVTWRLSAEYAAELLPAGGSWPLLVLAALLGSGGIPAAVFTAPAVWQYLTSAGARGLPVPGAVWNVVGVLERAGLVSAGPAGEPSVWVSAPVRAAARAAVAPDLAGLAVRAAADALVQAWPPDEPRSGMAAQMRACAAGLLGHAGDGLWAGGHCHRVLLRAGDSLTAARLDGPAAAWWHEVTARCERLLGAGHPDTLAAAGELAAALLAVGQAASAVACSRRVLAARDRVLGRGHPAAIAARVFLGRALAATGGAGEARTVLGEAAQLSQQAHHRGDPAALPGLEECAAGFLEAGDPATAVGLCEQALAGREQQLGTDAPATLAAALQLATASLASGDTKTAISQRQRVLAARERHLGGDHPDTLAARAGLAASYATAGMISDALREHQQACADHERVLGPGHPAALGCLADLAAAYCDAGQLGDAVTVLRQAIGRAGQALPADDPVTRRLQHVLDSITTA